MPPRSYDSDRDKQSGDRLDVAVIDALALCRHSFRSKRGMPVELTSDSHPTDADLVAFAVGELPPLRAEIVELHVHHCEQCAATIAKSAQDPFIERLRAAQRARPLVPTGLSQFRGIVNDAPLECADESADEANLSQLPSALRHHPRYRVIRLLARGGMGEVYLAEHRMMRNLVALKTIKPALAVDRESVLRFLQEVRVAGQLSHLNIARILDAEELGATAFLSMEYIRGKTLAQVVAKIGPLSVLHSSHYVRQIALGLSHACKKGVVHRDIKPQNVMLTESNGIVKILDFGLGRLVNEQRSRAGLTRVGDTLGTPDYMAPEQVRDARSATICSDIYSLGCTFYFLLAGAPPFAAENILDLLAKHESERATPIRSLRRDLPAHVADLIDRMMAKDPRHRPQTPQEIAQALSPRGATGKPTGSAAILPLEDSPSGRSLSRSLSSTVHFLYSPLILLPLLTVLISLFVLLMM